MVGKATLGNYGILVEMAFLTVSQYPQESVYVGDFD